MLKFSKANSKTKKLAKIPSLKKYIEGNRKIYSLDILSGWSCPFAKECHSKVVDVNGKLKVVDGPHTQFRCFSASQEALFQKVYKLRKDNFDQLRRLRTVGSIYKLISASIPKDIGICRIHVAGDFFKQAYFDGWIEVAKSLPNVLFYAYTKALPWWVNSYDNVPNNMVLTASYGGKNDYLIDAYGLRSAIVVFSKEEAEKANLEIDNDDSHAADPLRRNESFALLLHGTQPKGSEASRALSIIRSGS